MSFHRTMRVHNLMQEVTWGTFMVKTAGASTSPSQRKARDLSIMQGAAEPDTMPP
jgi:hypothetical protein